jgi:ABC-type multidrug transport system permease subunit
VFSSRRTKFGLIVLISQLLLIALAFVMLVEMVLIAINGLVQFVENNPVILTLEIVLTSLITAFGVFVFVLQLKRLGEKRNSDGQDRRSLPK